jgi:hypothetical protein
MPASQIEQLVPVSLVDEVIAAALADPKFEAAFLEAPQQAYRAKFVQFSVPRIHEAIVLESRAGNQRR